MATTHERARLALGGRHILAVSDGTAATCELLVKAALTQFRDVGVTVERIPGVRTVADVEAVFAHADVERTVVLHTLVSAELRQRVLDLGRARGVPTLDVLGPVLMRLSDLLGVSPLSEPGLFRQLDAEYFHRIEAVDFTVKHDDGLGADDLADAEIVLVGVSRVSKTPTSVYLAYRGCKVANIPVLPSARVPETLFQIDQQRVVGLTIDHDLLLAIRRHRGASLDSDGRLGEYAASPAVRRELVDALRLFRSRGWPVIDVSYKSIEETASEVLQLVGARGVASRP